MTGCSRTSGIDGTQGCKEIQKKGIIQMMLKVAAIAAIIDQSSTNSTGMSGGKCRYQDPECGHWMGAGRGAKVTPLLEYWLVAFLVRQARETQARVQL